MTWHLVDPHVTHNAVVADIADRIVRFSDGAVVELAENPVKGAPSGLTW